MSSNEFESLYNRQVSLLKQCKAVMVENKLTTVIKEITRIEKQLNVSHTQYIQMQSVIDRLPPASHTDNIEELFAQVMSKTQPPEDVIEEDDSPPSSDGEDEEMTVLDESLGDRSFVMSQPDGIPTDPITQKAICVPAKNLICHHVYEFDVIKTYLQRGSKKKPVKCPYIGCANKKLVLSDIIRDEKLQQEITAKMKKRNPASTSIVKKRNIVDLD